MKFALTYVRQKGTFSVDTFFPVFERADTGWIADFTLDYRLPKNFGLASLGVKNLSDQTIDLVETDPANPRIALGRFIFARLKLSF